MALMYTPDCNPNKKAAAFSLPGVDGKTYALEDIRGEKGTLIFFICNHCPYVKGIAARLPRSMQQLQKSGIGVAAVSSNDVKEHPEDSFENMKIFSEQHGFTFPYLYDETQQTARAYGAICTPDFFGFDRHLKLQYRGRLDSAGKEPATANTRQELLNAMLDIAQTGTYEGTQNPSMGCSIKWKPKAA